MFVVHNLLEFHKDVLHRNIQSSGRHVTFNRFVGDWPHLLSYHLWLQLIPWLNNFPAQTLSHSDVRDNTSHFELSSKGSIIETELLPNKVRGVTIGIKEVYKSVTADIEKEYGQQINIIMKGMNNMENRSTEWEISFLYRQATYIQKENGFCEQNGSRVKGIRIIVEWDGFVKFLSMHAQNLILLESMFQYWRLC